MSQILMPNKYSTLDDKAECKQCPLDSVVS